MQKIGFIGAGRMARAMVRGILAGSTQPPDTIGCVGGSGSSASELARETGIRCYDDAVTLANSCDGVVLAFKPHHLKTLQPGIEEATRDKCVLSVLAGVPIKRLSECFPTASNIVRAMPNIPAAIGSGVTGYACLKPLDGKDAPLVTRLLEAIGLAIEVDENQIDAVTGISGSGVAFVYEFMIALRDGGVEQGLPESVADQFVLQTVIGASRLLMESGLSLNALRDQVVTPGGTTEAGLKALDDSGFSRLIQDAVAAAAERSKAISDQA